MTPSDSPDPVLAPSIGPSSDGMAWSSQRVNIHPRSIFETTSQSLVVKHLGACSRELVGPALTPRKLNQVAISYELHFVARGKAGAGKDGTVEATVLIDGANAGPLLLPIAPIALSPLEKVGKKEASERFSIRCERKVFGEGDPGFATLSGMKEISLEISLHATLVPKKCEASLELEGGSVELSFSFESRGGERGDQSSPLRKLS